MKSRYIAAVSIGESQPALHVAGTNRDFAWDTAREKAEAMAHQRPGVEVRVDLSRWERGVWAWLDSTCYVTLQTTD